jgi:hypothetical protein
LGPYKNTSTVRADIEAISEASNMITSGSSMSPRSLPRCTNRRTKTRSAQPAMTQFRRGGLPRQSRYPFVARTTGTPSQTAARTETVKLTMRTISRPGALAMPTRVGRDQPQQASAPLEAMLLTTSGESDRTSFIVFLNSSTRIQMRFCVTRARFVRRRR